MDSPTLAVILEGRVIAHVERTDANVLRLTYEQEAHDQTSTPLSLSLPRGERSIAGRRVDTWLRALLPDSPRALQAVAKEAGVDVEDRLALLSAIGKDCAGAVQFCRPQDVEDTLARTEELDPASDSHIERRIAELRMSEDSSWVMREEHWSLGGTQNKFALRWHDERWHFALGAAPTSHIVKPGIHALKAQALVEHVTMRAAAECGLDVAETQYLDFKSERAIVISRFDRRERGGSLVRVHQEDMCQALGVWEKYEDEGGPSAQRVVRLLRDRARTAREARVNVDRFVQGVVFNTAVGAPDAHARNYAVLLDRDRVTLAPLFDVATALAYERTRPLVVSMSVGGEFVTDRIGFDQWSRFADDLGTDRERVLELVEQFAETVPGAVRRALDAVDDWDGDVSRVRRRLLPAMDAYAEQMVASTRRPG